MILKIVIRDAIHNIYFDISNVFKMALECRLCNKKGLHIIITRRYIYVAYFARSKLRL